MRKSGINTKTKLLECFPDEKEEIARLLKGFDEEPEFGFNFSMTVNGRFWVIWEGKEMDDSEWRVMVKTANSDDF